MVLSLLISTPQVPERGFEIRVTEQVLYGSRIDAGTVETAGESLPPLVEPPMLANGMILAGDSLLVFLSVAMPAVQSSPESKLLEIAQKMSIGLTIAVRENQITARVSFSSLLERSDHVLRQTKGPLFVILRNELNAKLPVGLLLLQRSFLATD